MGDDLQSKAADLVRKALTVGVGAIFLTEESLRTLVSEFKLPKELLTGVLESAGKAKDDFFQKLMTDIREKVVSRVEPAALLEEFLAKHDIELNVKMSFKKKDQG